MKQIFQDLKSGRTLVLEVPAPALRPGHALVRTAASVISAGTEGMLVRFGRANLLEKARQQPDKVRQVWDKIKTDGLLATVTAVRGKLDRPLALGYSQAGTVIAVGPGISDLAPGDLVATNGPHAEMVCVPQNLCAKIPAGVPIRDAAFTTLGAIALQGLRLAQPTLGERFVVTGLGLIGLIAVQLLQSQGVRVLGLDFDPARVELARRFGAEALVLTPDQEPHAVATEFSRGRGVDGVIIAAATKSSDPVHQAAAMCRKRGRIILVGVTGMNLSRADFYEKELTFQVSCSYGPGRYDPEYEEKGHDYPLGYIRWTLRRNFEAVLDLLAAGRLQVEPLVSQVFTLDEAEKAYDLVDQGRDCLGLVLEYPQAADPAPAETVAPARESRPVAARSSAAPVAVGFIGAGNFAAQILIPAFRRAGAHLRAVTSAGSGAGLAARKFGFDSASSDPRTILDNEEISLVVIATRHDTHADLVCQALAAGKHVFVEKPLAINTEQLDAVESVYRNLLAVEAPPVLMVGFNRRFAPQIMRIKALLAATNQLRHLIMTVNAGQIPAGHWTLDPAIGGGRIIGEVCHFVDLLRFLIGQPVTRVNAVRPGADQATEGLVLTLTYADGSSGTIHYLTTGHRSFSKERLEVFCSGAVLQLDNFRRLRGFGWPGFKRMDLWRQDKGHQAEVETLLQTIIAGGPPPIPFEEILETTRVTFTAAGPTSG